MNAVTPADAVVVLNRALREDPAAVRALFRHRVTCNADLANDPTIQVRAYEHHGDPRPPSVSVLGLINGLFGVDKADGGGWIAAEVDDDEITGFYIKPSSRKSGD